MADDPRTPEEKERDDAEAAAQAPPTPATPLPPSALATGTTPLAGVQRHGAPPTGPTQPATGTIPRADVRVSLKRTPRPVAPASALDVVIRKSTTALSFRVYQAFTDYVLCGTSIDTLRGLVSEEELALLTGDKRDEYRQLKRRRHLPYTDSDAYRLLKTATEAFVAVNCGAWIGDPRFTTADSDELAHHLGTEGPFDLDTMWNEQYLVPLGSTTHRILPYLALILKKFPDAPVRHAARVQDEQVFPEGCYAILEDKLTHPCLLELIWSYWHEEGMLVQTMNAISRRFQNVRGPAERDPLAMMEIDPLRPLNNVLWGYLQDEHHRLTVTRRAYEYDHHYGMSLYGKAVPAMRPADSRSKFIEAFHNLLNYCASFFKEDDDTTVIADGFSVMNALRDVHFLLAEGAHNQFGDLPSTARIEMLMQQWLLARPEFREFLPTRSMVGYPEPWMDRVDAMKRLQGWTDASVMEFNELAVFGEQILLSIRYGAWAEGHDPDIAANWARYWRAEIQGYIHAYRACTGVDITADTVEPMERSQRALQPSVLLRQRLALRQSSQPALPPAVARNDLSAMARRPAIGKPVS
jgi:hypothetical protein